MGPAINERAALADAAESPPHCLRLSNPPAGPATASSCAGVEGLGAEVSAWTDEAGVGVTTAPRSTIVASGLSKLSPCPMDIDATASETPKSLMSSQSKSSQLQVVVHPVVLFGLSDHVSRHFIRQQEGPIVGAILGQQNSREITMEHSFECHLRTAPEVDGGYLLDHHRFSSRLEQ
ncbi:hypothetical protein E4U54_000374, partial [Claviceps lovelessii]